MMENSKKQVGIGIDLGTANLLVFLENKGIIVNEPSVVAFDRESGKVVAAGREAYEMLGKVHDKIAVIKPLRDGVISDMKAAKALLSYIFGRLDTLTIETLKDTSTVICCPSEVTKIERDVMIDLAHAMGMGDTFIEEEIKSGALGAGVNIFESKGTMIVDIGGGTTDVGVLSFGDIVLSRTIRMAGNFIDNEIMKHVKKVHKVEIGELTAEKCKVELATLNEEKEEKTLKYAGRDIVRGIPKWFTLSSKEITTVIKPIFEEISELISAVLKDTAPELSADIFKNGILLTGGGALIDGIEEFYRKKIKVPITVVENPLTCVAEGTKLLLINRGDYLLNPIES